MSFKAKIAALVVLFVLVALFIGAAGTIAIKSQERTIRSTFSAAENLSQLKSLAFSMEKVAAKARDIIIMDELSEKARVKGELEKIIAEETAPLIEAFRPTAQEEMGWGSLVESWKQYEALLREVIELSLANSGYTARVMSTGASYQYWFAYVPLLTKLVEMSRTVNNPLADELAFQAQTCLEAIKGLQVQEKMGLAAVTPQARDGAFEVGKTELSRVSEALNTMEGIVTARRSPPTSSRPSPTTSPGPPGAK
jgi:hypothetical protein